MKFLPAIALLLSVLPCIGRAADLNLATLTCAKYENEVLPAAADVAPGGGGGADSINTVMWLFGYSVAKSGAHVMYPEALTPFGFALDGECKSNPNESVLDALGFVKPEAKNPIDLSNLECAAFASRHVAMAGTDHESADTIMMWLFGFSVAKSGGHVFAAGSVGAFQTALLADCAKHPSDTLFQTLSALRISKPVEPPATQKAIKPPAHP
jgi:hypothetical protein